MSYFKLVAESNLEGKASLSLKAAVAFCYLPLLLIETGLRAADLVLKRGWAEKFYFSTEHIATKPLTRSVMSIGNTWLAVTTVFLGGDISARHNGQSYRWSYVGSETIAKILRIKPYETDQKKLGEMIKSYIHHQVELADELAVYFDYKRTYGEAQLTRKLRDEVLLKNDYHAIAREFPGLTEEVYLEGVKISIAEKIDGFVKLSGYYTPESELLKDVLIKGKDLPKWKRPVEIPGQKATEGPSTEIQDSKTRRVKDSTRLYKI